MMILPTFITLWQRMLGKASIRRFTVWLYFIVSSLLSAFFFVCLRRLNEYAARTLQSEIDTMDALEKQQ
jgi:hypothetical protein